MTRTDYAIYSQLKEEAMKAHEEGNDQLNVILLEAADKFAEEAENEAA